MSEENNSGLGLATDDRAVETPEQELARLKEERDGPFVAFGRFRSYEGEADFPFRDCDAIFAVGTVVQLDGIDCTLLSPAAVRAPRFREESVFAEHLAGTGHMASFAANKTHFRNLYNGVGALMGLNPEHPDNVRNARIAELETEIGKAESVAVE